MRTAGVGRGDGVTPLRRGCCCRCVPRPPSGAEICATCRPRRTEPTEEGTVFGAERLLPGASCRAAGAQSDTGPPPLMRVLAPPPLGSRAPLARAARSRRLKCVSIITASRGMIDSHHCRGTRGRHCWKRCAANFQSRTFFFHFALLNFRRRWGRAVRGVLASRPSGPPSRPSLCLHRSKPPPARAGWHRTPSRWRLR